MHYFEIKQMKCNEINCYKHVYVLIDAWEGPDWDEWVKDIKAKWSAKSVAVEEQVTLNVYN